MHGRTTTKSKFPLVLQRLSLIMLHVNQARGHTDSFVRGHIQPAVYDGPHITVLSQTVNSNVTNVQLKCSNCTTWSTGKLNVQSTAADFVYAYGDSPPNSPSNPGSSFPQHVDHGGFALNLKNAQTTSTAAPTITGQPSSSGGHVGGLSERQWVLKTLPT